MPNFLENRPVVRTDTTKLIVAFCNFAKAPQNNPLQYLFNINLFIYLFNNIQFY